MPISPCQVILCASLGLGLVVYEAAAQEAPRGRLDHSNALWWGQFQAQSAKRDEVFILDRGLLNRDRQGEGRSTQESASWTLGLGEGSAQFLEGRTDGRWQKTYQDHQLALTLGLQASLYQGSTAFQDLEAQYILIPPSTEEGEPAPGKGLPSRAIDRSVQWGTLLGLADTYRASPSLDLKVSTDLRADRFRFDDKRDTASELVSGGVGFSKRWQRYTWDTNAQRNRLTFEDKGGNGLGRNQQILDSVDSIFSTPLAGRLRLGLGYQYFTSTFSDTPSRSVAGPALSLARASDGRFAWEARASLLRETGNTERQGQVFGSLNVSLRLTPRSNLVASVSKEIDLLRYYQAFTADRLVLNGEQQFTIVQSLQWELINGRSRWSLQLVRTEQKFEAVRVDNQSALATVTLRLDRSSDLIQAFELRRNSEGEGDVLAQGERRFLKASQSYRYRFGGSSRLLARPYVSGEWAYERLLDGAVDVKVERYTVLLALGQEWLL